MCVYYDLSSNVSIWLDPIMTECDQPGAVCQDPRFIGGDGITFYFHGKKDLDFCLLSDSNIHINAHFIGRRNQNMKRDFTWVQSIGVLFGSHQLYIGAQKTTTWDDSVDRLTITFEVRPSACRNPKALIGKQRVYFQVCW